MLRQPRHLRPLLLVLLTLAVSGAGAASAQAAAAAGDGVGPGAHSSSRGSAVLLTVYRVTPKVQRTVHFTGYATYTFSAPNGREIVSANTRIVGGQAHAVKVVSRKVSDRATRYVVKLVFPGEQGRPGKLVVRLLTIAG